jgi:hypothetical protein
MRLKDIKTIRGKMQLAQVRGSMGVLNVKLGYYYKPTVTFIFFRR